MPHADQNPPVHSKRAPVLPPGLPTGYPWRTFELHQPEEDVAHTQPGSDDSQRCGKLARLRERAAATRLGSMRAWSLAREHGTLSLCGCLALLLLSQVSVVSLLALQAPSSAQVVRSDSAAIDTSEAHRRPLSLRERALMDAVDSIPTGTASPTPPGVSPAPPAAISDTLSSDLGATYNTIGQPCHGSTFFVATITQWTVPPGCFATIYTPSPKNYTAVSGAFGWCNWWPEVLHPAHTDFLTNASYQQGSTPVPGAAIHFSPDVQGASSAGHYAQVVAVQPGSPWILVTEMNFTWRGGGFGKVDYRYVKVGPGMTFIYDSLAS